MKNIVDNCVKPAVPSIYVNVRQFSVIVKGMHKICYKSAEHKNSSLLTHVLVLCEQ